MLNGRKVICFVGSTDERYVERTWEVVSEETVKGNIVLMHSGKRVTDAETKKKLNALHRDKIEIADEVLVLNFDGYVGEGGREEIIFAWDLKKPVRFLFDRQS